MSRNSKWSRDVVLTLSTAWKEKYKDQRPTCRLAGEAPLKGNVTPHFSGLSQLFGICILGIRT